MGPRRVLQRDFVIDVRIENSVADCLSNRVTQIVLVSGGAGGLELATKLARRYLRNADIDILLVGG